MNCLHLINTSSTNSLNNINQHLADKHYTYTIRTSPSASPTVITATVRIITKNLRLTLISRITLQHSLCFLGTHYLWVCASNGKPQSRDYNSITQCTLTHYYHTHLHSHLTPSRSHQHTNIAIPD